MVKEVDFWEEKYQTAQHRWDLGQAAPPLQDYWVREQAPSQGDLVVLGCGQGHDAIFLARQGLTVTGVDFAPTAIAAARDLAQKNEVTLTLLEENIFDLPKSHKSHFDYLFEHTCFCAIAPEQRPDYVTLAASILKPGGKLYGIFYTHNREGGPPFGSTPQELVDLFSPAFEILSLDPIHNSIPSRQGDEHWAVFEKK
ncbi:thiopurine S-methyltransferase [[Synechococcus] sp. NIES-970]|uniref:methyltransferase domain-containing protein n=1 Tax=Picosynechococcus sp. NKBG15041c TaxID=1407650 RepID=UPI000414E800|nr:methyltransferase domain-containing protein [Picosynechococcus sp. NKBG15041c]BAW95625.1 thiopurine S-methyltransferase [[Synechococcus] sp. NIES-970]